MIRLKDIGTFGHYVLQIAVQKTDVVPGVAVNRIGFVIQSHGLEDEEFLDTDAAVALAGAILETVRLRRGEKDGPP